MNTHQINIHTHWCLSNLPDTAQISFLIVVIHYIAGKLSETTMPTIVSSSSQNDCQLFTDTQEVCIATLLMHAKRYLLSTGRPGAN